MNPADADVTPDRARARTELDAAVAVDATPVPLPPPTSSLPGAKPSCGGDGDDDDDDVPTAAPRTTVHQPARPANEAVEVDELDAMFSNLIKGGLMSRADLVENGFTGVAERRMVGDAPMVKAAPRVRRGRDE